MKGRRLMRGLLGSIAVLLLLAGCAIIEAATTPTSSATLTPITAPTFTPDPCTGWRCTVTGVAYTGTIHFGNELESVTVTLHQTSFCSPTRGQHRTTTDSDGRFEFSDVFFHDTDRIQIQVESEGYESAQWDSKGSYCLFCSCFGSPLEIVLHAAPGQ